MKEASPRAWVTPYLVILVCYLLNFALFQFAYPFIPLFLVQLGETQNAAIAWTGLSQAVGSVALMVANPVWGAMGDRLGRKRMVIRAMLGGTLTLTMMGLATQAWQLFAARVLQGVLGGSSVELLTLAALTLPRPRLAIGMGLMQTAQFLGTSLGPLMGSAAVGLLGYRGTFFAAAVVMLGLVAVTFLFVRDVPVTPRAGKRQLSLVQRLIFVGRIPRLRGIILATLSFQLSYTCSISLLPIHLIAVAGDQDAPRAVGTVLAASAIGGALGSVVLGAVASRIGAGTVSIVAFVLAGVFLVPQAWLETTAQIAAFRFATDFFGGGILPALRTLLAEEAARHESTASSMGSIYGLSQSASAGGMALGAVVATVVGTALGTGANFVVAGALAIATGLMWEVTVVLATLRSRRDLPA